MNAGDNRLKTISAEQISKSAESAENKPVKVQSIIINNSHAGQKFKKFDKTVRVITVAPIMAAMLLSLIFIFKQAEIGIAHYILSLVFLTALPMTAYPLAKVIPPIRAKGRDGERNLAIAMAVAGYVFGTITAIIFQAPTVVLQVYLTYLFSGIGIVVFNKGLKIKASGHACGVAGPIIFLTYIFGAWALFGAALLIPVFVASVRMKRHTLAQLALGVIIVACSFAIAITVSYLVF